MKVTVVGKEYVCGTSKKTGQPFESVLAHVTYLKMGVQGVAVESIWLDPITCPLASVVIDGVYNVDRDNRGRLLAFEPAAPENLPENF